VAPGLRRLYSPQPATVATAGDGAPHEVDGVVVAAVREEWLVEDSWWAPKELRRRYFELALVDGRSTVVFNCALSGRWYRQRA